MLQAIIFDMDGLLIDSEPFWQQAEIEVFAEVGLHLNSDLCHQTMGLRIDEVVNYWYQRHPWQGISQADLAQKIVQRVVELIETKGVAREGVYPLLDYLSSTNLPLALASSSDLILIKAVLNCLHLEDTFTVIASATTEAYGKPHPAVYLTTAEKLGVTPTHCLAIEDSLNGVLAAKAARMACFAVPESYPEHNPKLIIADEIFPSLVEVKTELAAWLEESHKV
ncbi:MAG: hexitol phosphatase HxpB [Cyanobacteria bacterium SW_9_44_58]|nr:MAG: hexitol phosphatase HxpB [Cyanobacteria bacterium SW_9_44_58]